MTDSDNLIIRSKAAIEDASMAQLVATYNALTGRTPDGEGTARCITRFESREVGKRRVEMAMLAAQDADGHLGVPKGKEGEVKTAEELAEKAAEKGQDAPNMNPDAPQFPAGTLAGQLQAQAGTATPITKRPRKDQQPKAARPAGRPAKAEFVRRAEADKATTKVRPDSQRGQVLAAIDALGKDSDGVVSIKAIGEHCAQDVRGPVIKLIEFGYLVACAADGSALAPAARDTTGQLPGTEEPGDEAQAGE